MLICLSQFTSRYKSKDVSSSCWENSNLNKCSIVFRATEREVRGPSVYEATNGDTGMTRVEKGWTQGGLGERDEKSFTVSLAMVLLTPGISATRIEMPGPLSNDSKNIRLEKCLESGN